MSERRRIQNGSKPDGPVTANTREEQLKLALVNQARMIVELQKEVRKYKRVEEIISRVA